MRNAALQGKEICHMIRTLQLLTLVLIAESLLAQSVSKSKPVTREEYNRLRMQVYSLKDQVFQAKVNALFSFNLNRAFFVGGYFFSYLDYSNVDYQAKNIEDELDKIRYKYALVLYTLESGSTGHTYAMQHERLVRVQRYKTEFKNALKTILESYREVYSHDFGIQISDIRIEIRSIEKQDIILSYFEDNKMYVNDGGSMIEVNW